MKVLEYIATKNDNGKCIKQIISYNFKLSSRTLTKLKKNGGIKVNGNSTTVRYCLNAGDVLTLEIEDAPSLNITPVDIPLDVLYEDDDILVVNKPYGMPTHPSQNHHTDTLANAVMHRYKDRNFTFRAITRLDGDTTGVVLIALNALSAQRLTDDLQSRNITKQYCAVVLGVPFDKEGVIEKPIARCENSVIKRKIDQSGKPAVTKYRVEKSTSDGKYCLVTAFPITGRTHQIRLHLSSIGHSIYGDFLYGEPIDNVRAYLHCASLTFSHPMTKEKMCITSPLPDDMTHIMETK